MAALRNIFREFSKEFQTERARVYALRKKRTYDMILGQYDVGIKKQTSGRAGIRSPGNDKMRACSISNKKDNAKAGNLIFFISF